MRDLRPIEAQLSRNLKVTSVQALEGFPFASHADFVAAQDSRRVDVMTAFDGSLVPTLGTQNERGTYYAMTWSPFGIALACAIGALATADYWMFLGVPLAFVGMFLSTPAFMNSFGMVPLVAGGYAIYEWFWGDLTRGVLFGSFSFSNYLCCVARSQCDVLVREAIRKSELVLIWLYSAKTVVLRKR